MCREGQRENRFLLRRWQMAPDEQVNDFLVAFLPYKVKDGMAAIVDLSSSSIPTPLSPSQSSLLMRRAPERLSDAEDDLHKCYSGFHDGSVVESRIHYSETALDTIAGYALLIHCLDSFEVRGQYSIPFDGNIIFHSRPPVRDMERVLVIFPTVRVFDDFGRGQAAISCRVDHGGYRLGNYKVSGFY